MTNFFVKRLPVYAFALLYVVAMLLMVWQNGDAGDLRTIRLTEGFALGAVAALYITLTVGPVYKVFPNLSGKEKLLSLRGGFGDVALVFGIVHASLAFWGLLGGFAGWVFLGGVYQVATVLSLTALVLLAALFASGLGNMKKKVFGRYPWFGKLGYVAGVLLLIHIILIGSHFRSTNGSLFIVGALLVAFLLVLLAQQIDSAIANRFKMQKFMGATLVALLVIGLYGGKWYMTDSSNAVIGAMDHANMPGMNIAAPSSTSQFTVSVQIPPQIKANTPVPLSFKVFAANTGTPVTQFDTIHDKLAHLVIVNDRLEYYSHIHPEFKDGQFAISVTFPQEDNYRAYMSVEPKGSSEQVFAYSFKVGSETSGPPGKIIDGASSKTVSAVTVTLSNGGKLSAADIASGKAKLVFHFTDNSGQPLANLYPYLAAFGHLVMISTDSYSYLHVHPLIVPFGPGETSGPDVEFMVMGNVESGIYKLFGQFNPGKQLITVPYTIEITQ